MVKHGEKTVIWGCMIYKLCIRPWVVASADDSHWHSQSGGKSDDQHHGE